MDKQRKGEKEQVPRAADSSGKDVPAELVLENEEGKVLAFRKVFATEKDGVGYCILAPVQEVSGISPDEAFVFRTREGKVFSTVRDVGLSEEVFAEYYRSLSRGGQVICSIK